MARAKRETVEQFNAVVEEAAKGLSNTAISALLAHPEAVRSALAVAADALSKPLDDAEVLRGIDSPRVSAKEARQRIAARARPDTETELLTVQEVAELTGLKTRQSVHDWLKKDKILGWQGAKRGYVFPREQFDERGRPPEGLGLVVRALGDPYATWHWISTELLSLDGATPLAYLRAGELDSVLIAAEGEAQGDFV